jgi:hypothetical protein
MQDPPRPARPPPRLFLRADASYPFGASSPALQVLHLRHQ